MKEEARSDRVMRKIRDADYHEKADLDEIAVSTEQFPNYDIQKAKL